MQCPRGMIHFWFIKINKIFLVRPDKPEVMSQKSIVCKSKYQTQTTLTKIGFCQESQSLALEVELQAGPCYNWDHLFGFLHMTEKMM